MCRNADILYYPIRPAIESVLPIVDEFVVAIGKGDAADKTREIVASIPSEKIRIIDTVWDTEAFPNGTENAHQTDLAMRECSGDWLLYLQADEVIHERYLETIYKRCEELLNNRNVEALLLRYLHFWGDYWHYHSSHSWYDREIRIVRNDPEIHSWESAQSFRRIPNFDGRSYRQHEGTFKLKAADAFASVYHYGWVRPPRLMQDKCVALDSIHHGAKAATERHGNTVRFHYGNMKKLKRFRETHPAVMREWIERFDWDDELSFSNEPLHRQLFKHERLRYRTLSWVENNLLFGKRIGAFKNYHLIRV